MEMFVNILRKKCTVEKVESLYAFIKLLLRCRGYRNIHSAIVYGSLMFPFIFLLRLFRPSISVYYMVRGDEITYVKHYKRYLRALIAVIFQKLLLIFNCKFVFVCEDLRCLFEKRLGLIKKSYVLPNTLGKPLPSTRPFDGRLSLVGDFNTVKNIEWAIENLSGGRFEVHLFGNQTLPEKWRRPWLYPHGVVGDLKTELLASSSLLILADTSAGFPNILVEALEAGCGVLVHREFPFKYLPISDNWRFSLSPSNNGYNGSAESELETVLNRLLREGRDFKHDNPELVKLIESDWQEKVWKIFE